jgi:hypothetical protein
MSSVFRQTNEENLTNGGDDSKLANMDVDMSGELEKSLHDVEDAKRKLDYEVGTLLSPDGKVINR